MTRVTSNIHALTSFSFTLSSKEATGHAFGITRNLENRSLSTKINDNEVHEISHKRKHNFWGRRKGPKIPIKNGHSTVLQIAWNP